MDKTLLKVQQALVQELDYVNQRLGNAELNDYQRQYYNGMAEALKRIAMVAMAGQDESPRQPTQ